MFETPLLRIKPVLEGRVCGDRHRLPGSRWLNPGRFQRLSGIRMAPFRGCPWTWQEGSYWVLGPLRAEGFMQEWRGSPLWYIWWPPPHAVSSLPVNDASKCMQNAFLEQFSLLLLLILVTQGVHIILEVYECFSRVLSLLSLTSTLRSVISPTLYLEDSSN